MNSFGIWEYHAGFVPILRFSDEHESRLACKLLMAFPLGVVVGCVNSGFRACACVAAAAPPGCVEVKADAPLGRIANAVWGVVAEVLMCRSLEVVETLAHQFD